MFHGSGFHLRITPRSRFSNDRPGHGGPQLVAGIGGALIAIDGKDGSVVGASRLHGFDADNSEIENIWLFLAKPHWGGAYNREMKQLIFSHL